MFCMRLVIGGKAQGKLDYVKAEYSIPDEKICRGSECSDMELADAECIYGLEDFIWNKLEKYGDEDFDAGSGFMNLIPELRDDAIVICAETGLGVVPVERKERIYRDAVGRICCGLAKRAESVERIYCGIAQKIKQQ